MNMVVNGQGSRASNGKVSKASKRVEVKVNGFGTKTISQRKDSKASKGVEVRGFGTRK